MFDDRIDIPGYRYIVQVVHDLLRLFVFTVQISVITHKSKVNRDISGLTIFSANGFQYCRLAVIVITLS